MALELFPDDPGETYCRTHGVLSRHRSFDGIHKLHRPRKLRCRKCRDYIRGQVDARIYVRNIPAEYNEDLLRGIIAQYGSATVVELLKSRLVNGKRSGFIHACESHKQIK